MHAISAPTAQVQCDTPKPTRDNGVRLILTSKFAGIYMGECHTVLVQWVRSLHATQSRHSFKPLLSNGIAAALTICGSRVESQGKCWDFLLKYRMISALIYIYIYTSELSGEN